MYDRELDQRLNAMHDLGVHCAGRDLRLTYDPNTTLVVLRADADGARAVGISYACLSRHLGEPGPGETGQFGRVEALLCAVYRDPLPYGAADLPPVPPDAAPG